MKYNPQFVSELTALINKYSIENNSDTTDFILAEYLVNCLDSFNKGIVAREAWYGRITTPCEPPVSGSYSEYLDKLV